MTDAEFLQEVKRNVQQIDPQAQVWLFGSRARGDARDDSDWDFLVLTDKPVDWMFKRRLRDYLFQLGLDSERTIGTLIQNRDVWEDLEVTDLYQNVQEDAIAV